MGNLDLPIALSAIHYLSVAPNCIKQHERCKQKQGLDLTTWTVSYLRWDWGSVVLVQTLIGVFYYGELAKVLS